MWKLDDEAGMVETRYQVTATMGMEDDSADNRGGKENGDFTIYIYGVIGSSRPRSLKMSLVLEENTFPNKTVSQK